MKKIQKTKLEKAVADGWTNIEDIYRFKSSNGADYLMKNGKFSCGFNMPEALSGEQSFGLPPYNKRKSFLVDEYPACPENWMRSEGKIKSFFVPVQEGKGMWLDFNANNETDYHVAIVISIQGVNPITGLPCKDAQLEQYIDTCPKHNKKFGPDRYCEKCGFKWPKQNYISTTGTSSGSFWIDGFKSADGIVRQYILTAEKMRGVASNIIGKDRVYAIGLSYFLSKEKKPTPTYTYRGDGNFWHYTSPNIYGDNIKYFSSTVDYLSAEPTMCFMSSTNKSSSSTLTSSSSSNFTVRSKLTNGDARSIKAKKLEVGAGAKIRQEIADDPEKLDFWHNEPESIICINYVVETEAEKILQGGRVEIKSHPEGFLKEIPVGN